MCLAVHKKCECNTNTIQFHMRDNVLPEAVVTKVFCPSCPGNHAYDEETMVSDNGWYIEYDMVLARSFLAKRNMMDMQAITPEYIFDQGYASWLETYPGEKQDMQCEKEKIVSLLQVDQKKYLQKIQQWNIDRMQKLKEEGWRKAQLS